jgi:SHS2 domain-containing protein
VHRWVDHTSEVELHVEAASQEEVFHEALAALRELMLEHGDPDESGEALRHEVTVSALDRATLLAEWLAELAYLAEVEGLLPERAEGLELTQDSVSATIAGTRSDPSHLVKAVTYHRLAFEERDDRWYATVILDV